MGVTEDGESGISIIRLYLGYNTIKEILNASLSEQDKSF